MSGSKQGWGWPLNSRKAHYFVEHTALCGKWLFFGSLEDSEKASPDDCVVCRRKLDKMKAKDAKRHGRLV